MSHYEVLGVPPGAAKDAIRAAYKRQALATHPDKGGCKEAFHAVTRAFETLFDDAIRARYDDRLARGTARSERRPSGQPSAQPPEGRPSGPPTARPPQAAGAPPCHSPPRRAPSGEQPGCNTGCPGRARSGGPGEPEDLDEQRAQFCEKLHALLRQLRPAARLAALQTAFGPNQRRVLEQWMVAHRAAAAPAGVVPSGVPCAAPHTGASGVNSASPAGSASGSSSSEDGGESSDEGPDARRALEGGPVLAEPRAGGRGRSPGGHGTRGIHCKLLKSGRFLYCADVVFDGLAFHTSYVQDLATVLDFHVALMTVKERLRETCLQKRVQVLQSVISGVLQEQGLLGTLEDIGLKVGVSIHSRFLFGAKLKSPYLPLSQLPAVMEVWERIVLRFVLSNPYPGGLNFYHHYDPCTIQDMWGAVREEFPKIWAAAGKDAHQAERALEARHAEMRPHQQQQLERWNTWRMKLQDGPTYRSYTLAERRVRSAQCVERRAQRREAKLLHMVSLWLLRWRRLEERADAAGQKRRRLEEAARRAAERSRREARWRWVSRRDLTVEEMLRGPPVA